MRNPFTFLEVSASKKCVSVEGKSASDVSKETTDCAFLYMSPKHAREMAKKLMVAADLADAMTSDAKKARV